MATRRKSKVDDPFSCEVYRALKAAGVDYSLLSVDGMEATVSISRRSDAKRLGMSAPNCFTATFVYGRPGGLPLADKVRALKAAQDSLD